MRKRKRKYTHTKRIIKNKETKKEEETKSEFELDSYDDKTKNRIQNELDLILDIIPDELIQETKRYF